MASVSQGSVLKRNSWLQAKKGSSADERTDPIGIAILRTLAYSDHFGFPLTLPEIHLRFVGANPCIRPLISRAVGQMLAQNLIQQTGSYYHLPGRSSLVARRLFRLKLSTPQLARARTLALRLGHTPGVLAIYLTGSLAMSNSGKNSDIDFMVITQPGRLWTTRLLLTIYTSILGLRRTPHSTHNTGKLCLNLYLTPKTYCLPPSKQSLYTAYELVQAIPLYDSHNTHSDLFLANPWIHGYLPNWKGTVLSPRYDQLPRTLLKRNAWLQAKQGPAAAGRRVLMGIIEFLCYHFQLAYMWPKLTREHITPDSAFFHPHDPSPLVSKV